MHQITVHKFSSLLYSKIRKHVDENFTTVMIFGLIFNSPMITHWKIISSIITNNENTVEPS